MIMKMTMKLRNEVKTGFGGYIFQVSGNDKPLSFNSEVEKNMMMIMMMMMMMIIMMMKKPLPSHHDLTLTVV